VFKPALRFRIAAAFAIVCISVVGAFGITLYTASEELEDGLVQQLVAEELAFLVERHRAGRSEPPVQGSHLQYYIAEGAAAKAALPAALRVLGPGHHDVGWGEAERHVAVQDDGDTRYAVAYDPGAHEVRESQFRHLLLFSLATVVVIAIVLGYWLGGLLTGQLSDLARRVSGLVPGTAGETLARPGQDREVAAVAAALDDYQARMLDMISREQEFTANASHELRTPLTAIGTSCELLAADASLSEKGRQRVAYISAACARMAEQIMALLFLARDQAPANREAVDLAECAADAAEPFRSELARQGTSLEIAIAPGTVLELNRQALQLVLGNLIRNAVEHTAHGSVRLTYDAPRLTVADTGAGIAPEHLPHVLERHYRGGQRPEGFGLGLAIVKRICDQFHWQIDVVSEPKAGSAFSITLS